MYVRIQARSNALNTLYVLLSWPEACETARCSQTKVMLAAYKHNLRGPVQDLVRMADAAVATSVRRQVEAQSGSSSLALRMVPQAANESKYADLAQRLEAALARPDGPPAPFSADQLSASGLPDPSRIKAFVDDVLKQVESTLPRVQSLASHPTVRKMIVDFTAQSVQRVAARSVKFAFAGAGLPQGR